MGSKVTLSWRKGEETLQLKEEVGTFWKLRVSKRTRVSKVGVLEL